MPNRLNKLFVLPFAICYLLSASGCVTIYNPATQKRETLLIGTKQEVSLGQSMDRQIQRELPILKDTPQQERLDRIGQKVAGASDRQDLEYHFKIIKDKDLNAFAVPGGFVYLNSGLIDAAGDDELACVLAHEIGHIAARHSVKKLQASLGYQVVMNIIWGVGGAQTVSRAISITFNLVSLGYSRKDEFLADKLAVKYAYNSGFNPQGMVTFFEKLQKEAQNRGPDFNLVFLSSHPPIKERIKNAQNEIANVSRIPESRP
ncbi:MAG: M48 family metalloprotease [Candidatus Omnitrophica bacterium]|nr:M48 family metalloprotease [Candidatus Omnitrophota bacterium]MBU4345786.1 M48 family metalloprotease [Candidatus Omnitrophota bacterium]MBU4473455.1 M48 family metalloprotease [Candidatus Omnitrophota bacterium]MCG2706210.1 M48 family metallopeptidase [Candidatus Omnitrophota bacterium]